MGLGEAVRVNSLSARLAPAGWLAGFRAALLSVVFPAPCRICEQLLTEPTRIPICNACLDSFQPIDGCVCQVCGMPVEAGVAPDATSFVCPLCKDPEHRTYAFDRTRSWSFYEGAMV